MKSPIIVACCMFFAGCTAASAGENPAAAAQPEEAPRERRNAPPVDATRVEVAAIEITDAELNVSIPGEVEGARDALLAAPQGGQIEAVLVREGAQVRAGQPLVRIDTSVYEVHAARARAELDQAEYDDQRMQTLKGVVTGVERESANTKLRIAESAQKLAELQLARSIIRAPFAGTVAKLNAEVGEVTTPGTTVVRLVQLNPILVTLSVPDRDVVALKHGDRVQVRANAHAHSLEGVIKRISPAADLKTRTFSAEIEVNNAGRVLLPGMIATVHVTKRLASGGVVIPQEWLVTTRKETGVYVVEEDEQGPRARWQPVQPGQIIRDQVVILEGLEQGNRVVVTGHRDLADKDRLIIVREGRCCSQGRAFF